MEASERISPLGTTPWKYGFALAVKSPDEN
jgi:hypothetical protein